MKRKLAFLLVMSLVIVNGVLAQSSKSSRKTTLIGIVVDTANRPVPNASVFVDGKNVKVLSGEKGLFKIKIKPKVKLIMVFTLDQGAREMNYQGEDSLTFVLDVSDKVMKDPLSETQKEESDMLNMGYVNAHKRNISTNVRSVKKGTLKKSHTYTTIYDMIQGEVSGVTVYGEKITIRGKSSITQSNQPLFVVNGMPVSSINHLSPSQVKSISILKGSSAAIYGVRGANGVIVITLKTIADDM